MTATSSGGLWQNAFNVGNPIPGIFTSSETSSITITTGGLFTFLSFDLGTGGQSNPSYTYQGFLNGLDILDGSGTLGGNSFVTIFGSNPNLALDSLVITTTLTSSSANLDNIAVGSVPEPGTVGLLGAGLAAIVFARRRYGAKVPAGN